MSITLLFVTLLVCQVQARIFINRGNSVKEIDDNCLGPLNNMLDGSSCTRPEMIAPPVITLDLNSVDLNNIPVNLQDNEILLAQESTRDDQIILQQESTQGQQLNRFQIKLGATLGQDTRKKVPFTNQIPYRSVGQIDGRCTASVIGPRHILTAAHCIENNSKWTFFPARDSLFYKPYGEYDWSVAYIPDEYLSRQDDFFEHDYAIIVLKNNLDPQIPPFKFNFNCDEIQITENLNVVGYPNDRFRHTMWKTGCRNIEINCGQKYFWHECDTYPGMSGSPMFSAVQKEDGNVEYVIHGIHGGAFGREINFGIIMKEKIQQQIQQWLEVFP